MKNVINEISRKIDVNKNKIIDGISTRSIAASVLMGALHKTNTGDNGGCLINEELDLVVIAVSKEQRKKDPCIISFTRSCDDIITTKAPTLPIPNGIYRGRTKTGSFTLIGYYDNIIIDLGCCERSEIRVTDPFWIDLRRLKYTEYISPYKKQLISEHYERECARLRKHLEEEHAENIKLHDKIVQLSEELKEFKGRSTVDDENDIDNGTPLSDIKTDEDEDEYI